MNLCAPLLFALLVTAARVCSQAPSPLPGITPKPAEKSETKAPAAEAEIPFPAHLLIPPATVLTPEEMLATLQLPRGFKAEIAASEPLISTPVAIQFDPDGRLWVVEMNGYMPNVDGKGEEVPSGRVVVLEDTNGDGRMDKSTTFLDQLVLPRAIMLRKGGALVAVPPVLYWCPDANGDLKADEQVPLVPTYATGGNPEHMPNGLLLALDNWIYNAKSNRRFRFLQNGEMKNEATLFRGQWGICQDDLGRLHYNYNSDQLRADLVPSAYLARNPNFKSPPGVNDQIAKSQRVFPGRVTPGVNRGYRKGMLIEGKLAEFTGASGPLVYRGNLLPEEFRGNSFVPEPAANLVKRNIHTERDGDVMARDAYEAREFLTSTSERFRPVNVNDGPDGAIYVTDIARGLVQHITYVTPWLRRQILERGLEQPLNHGRIWRIVPEGVEGKPLPKLAKATSAELVAQLASRNGWTRDTAQRLLVERADAASIPLLEDLAKSAPGALARLHALWTLEGLEELSPALVAIALSDREGTIRAAAVRLADAFLRTEPKLVEQLLKMTTDPASEVQLQLLATLGELRTPAADAAMVAILNRVAENRLARSVAISGLKGRELEFLQMLMGAPEWANETPGRANVLAQLAKCVLEEHKAERVSAALELLASHAAEATWQQTAMANGLTGIVPVPQPAAGSIAAQQAKLGAKPQGSTGLPKGFKPMKVASEPAPLAALAASTQAELKPRAARLAALFVWPGKPGFVEEPKRLPLSEPQKEFVAAGKQMYLALCAACHQPGGQGQEGLAPPLANSDWAEAPEGRLIRIVLQGIGGPLTVNGKDYSLDMPGLGLALNDEQIAQILSYIRNDLGNEASVVETAAVKKVREATKDRGASWTADELLNIH